MKKFQQLKLLTAAVLLLAIYPIAAFAQETVVSILRTIGGLIGTLIPVLVALALLYFFWGLAKFILNADNEQARSDGKQIMVWGIIALFVIVAVWGLVTVIQTTFGVTSQSADDIIDAKTLSPIPPAP